MTVIVIGILAAVAMPQYGRTVERGYWRAAQDALQMIYAGEQVYQSLNKVYLDPVNQTCPAFPVTPAWGCIYMDNPNTGPTPVTYAIAVAVGLPPTFTATATRRAGTFMTMNQSHALNTANWPQP